MSAAANKPSRLDVLTLTERLNPAVFANEASGGSFRLYRHLMYIGERIAQCAVLPNSRLIINVPPRHMKSYLGTFWTPVWYLNLVPMKNVIIATHSQSLGNMWGRKIRNEIRTNGACTNTSLSKDSTAANRFNTPQGGGLTVFGIDAAATGFGADLLVVDDPHRTQEQTYSKRAREKVHRWWDEMYSRMNAGASAMIIMQRMHPDDLCGYIMRTSSERWDVVSLPALAEENDPMGRKVGEPLCPSAFSAKDFERIRVATRDGWLGRYQQRPADTRSGAVYPEFSSAAFVGNVDPAVELVPHYPLCMSIDFNVRPGMHAVLGQYFPDKDRFTAVHEIFEDGLDLRGMMRKFKEFVDEYGWRYPCLEIFGDASGSQRTVENAAVGETHYSMVKAALMGMGFEMELGSSRAAKRFRIRVPKRNPLIVDRVMAVNAVLCDLKGTRRYSIHPRCEELIDDFRTLRNGEDGAPDKSDLDRSHSSDAEGYRIHYTRPRLVPRQ